MYRGRFAPSPTGPLHFGSLIAAVGSYLDARSHHGEWWVRIEDIDPPREVAGAADGILRTLEQFGFEWDGPVIYQSQRLAQYEVYFEQLQQSGWSYPCACTRKSLSESHPDAHVYPGTCRNGLRAGQSPRTWRMHTHDNMLHYVDRIQGKQSWQLANEIGDYVIKRADGLYAYQLAVALDDALQNMTHVIRGSDLLDSTPRQIHIQNALDLNNPVYGHLPVATNQAGDKLSKQTGAAPVDQGEPSVLLWQVFDFLGQCPPDELQHAPLTLLWDWAMSNWRLEQIPVATAISAETKDVSTAIEK